MRRGRFEHPFLKRQTQMVTEDGLAVWEATLDVQKFPYLRDHQVDGEIVFPATGHLELAWAVASEQFRHEPFFLENLHFDSPLILPDNSRHPLEVRLEIVSGEGDYRICSRPADAPAETPWSRHSSGRINTTHDRFEKSDVTLADLRQQFRSRGSDVRRGVLREASRGGSGVWREVPLHSKLRHRGHEMLARLRTARRTRAMSRNETTFTRHSSMPACMSCSPMFIATATPSRIFLPYRIDRVRFYRRPTRIVWSHVRDHAQ